MLCTVFFNADQNSAILDFLAENIWLRKPLDSSLRFATISELPPPPKPDSKGKHIQIFDYDTPKGTYILSGLTKEDVGKLKDLGAAVEIIVRLEPDYNRS